MLTNTSGPAQELTVMALLLKGFALAATLNVFLTDRFGFGKVVIIIRALYTESIFIDKCSAGP